MTHFRLYCAVYIFVDELSSHRLFSPVGRFISDFHALATSRDEYKRVAGETELPVMISVCTVSVVRGMFESQPRYLLFIQVSQRHIGHFYVDHGGVRPTLYLHSPHLHQILTPRDLTIWNSIFISPPVIYKDRSYAAEQDVS
jgi:hypothetical protein